MTLDVILVKKFQSLYFDKFKTEISYNKAEIELKELTDIVRITSRQDKNENILN